jgi:uncharacterized membrane protein YedE/YeeE
MKPLRVLLFLLAAAILILASLGAGKTVKEGLEEKRIMNSGRRTSRLVDKEQDPQHYWVVIGFNTVVGVGLFGAGLWMAVKAFTPERKR